ncbi:regulator of protease activity HflC (stomatin/prohibitin superfamily) [Mycoplasmopsis mustelae]|uniref:Regulator of protease activity HflC (Stomatin/prohibitin superfamily) n=1 Tax=Mycoplasmopsis mustelae TaxID=171289 RepID=A0A4R7UD34_9BACT|nr:SPFH domain-containing protein [Mycoplasmopsis mustelae]TDV24367.1 regulator of protease activity HflC (stomatin/prohibitin superfamily) [Mycoplasmopsis mustelae]
MQWWVTLIIVLVVLTILLVFVIITIVKSIKIVNQSEFFVVERLGKYHKIIEKGINFLIPFIDRIVGNENFKEKVFDFPEQDVITKDNAIVKVDTVVYLSITDPKLYKYGAENPIRAIENLSATTLRNLLGELELDECLTSRDTINSKLTIVLDEASDAWGIKVHRVEIKNILPPTDIQSAMEKQMRAEREKRANILTAEGEREAQILRAQGEKQAKILQAEADKESQILRAEAQKQESILRAEGERKAIELLNSSPLTSKILTLRSIEQLGNIANGKATKIIIPPNLSDVAKTMSVASEFFNEKVEKK